MICRFLQITLNGHCVCSSNWWECRTLKPQINEILYRVLRCVCWLPFNYIVCKLMCSLFKKEIRLWSVFNLLEDAPVRSPRQERHFSNARGKFQIKKYLSALTIIAATTWTPEVETICHIKCLAIPICLSARTIASHTDQTLPKINLMKLILNFNFGKTFEF